MHDFGIKTNDNSPEQRKSLRSLEALLVEVLL